ncbi:hypothetical protein EI94DRAFT_1733847 [Lactarius quietus]|nr:hypothetical protein EI94DRAFT_1733847 [Lactarius quietus]
MFFLSHPGFLLWNVAWVHLSLLYIALLPAYYPMRWCGDADIRQFASGGPTHPSRPRLRQETPHFRSRLEARPSRASARGLLDSFRLGPKISPDL